MLVVRPETLEFEIGESNDAEESRNEQKLHLENSSDSAIVTFKIEANCSPRYKVHPIIGTIAPGSAEVISVRLRVGEASKPEDRFLIRSAVYDSSKKASPKQFWNDVKNAIPAIPHEKVIINVANQDSNSPHLDIQVSMIKNANSLSEQSVLNEMQSFYRGNNASNVESFLDQASFLNGPISHGFDVLITKDNNQESKLGEGTGQTAGLDYQSSLRLLVSTAREAREDPQRRGEMVLNVAALCAKHNDHLGAAAWYDCAAKLLKDDQAAQAQILSEVYDQSSNADEFQLLCAKEEVSRQLNPIPSKVLEVLASPPPPPPPPPPPLSHSLPSASKRYAAPTESSSSRNSILPHSLVNSPSITRIDDDDSQRDVLRKKLPPVNASFTRENRSPRKEVAKPVRPRPVGASRPMSIELGSTVSRASTATFGSASKKRTEYILEVAAAGELWADRGVSALSCKVALQGVDVTVREMKNLALRAFQLDPTHEDVDLFVMDILLSDHWRGSDFGLRPGITRVEMRRRGKPAISPAKAVSEQPSERKAIAVTSPPPPPPPPPPPSVTEKPSTAIVSVSLSTEDSLRQECAILSSRVFQLEEINTRLTQELQHLGKEYDTLAARLLNLSKEKERAEFQKGQTEVRLKSALETLAMSKVTSSPSRSQGSASVHEEHPRVGAVCVVSSPQLLVPAGEEEEDYFEGEETAVHLSEDGSSIVVLDQEFLFDACMDTSAPERVFPLITDDIFDEVMEGGARTILVLGETFSGKAALVEGLDPQGLSESSPARTAKDIARAAMKLSPTKQQQVRRPGLAELMAVRLFSAVTAAAVESAGIGAPRSLANRLVVNVSGFQTFRDRQVIDFLSATPKEEDCEKLLVASITDFERALRRMLKRKRVMHRRNGNVPCKGDPSDPDSCVVITFELSKLTDPTFKGKLRLIEACGAEAGGDPLVGRIIEGIPLIVVLAHPSIQHAEATVDLCETGLEVARKFVLTN